MAGSSTPSAVGRFFLAVENYINTCDLDHLDGIGLALFTLALGIGILVAIYLLASLNFFSPPTKYPGGQTIQAQFSVNDSLVSWPARFGKPRSDVNSWHTLLDNNGQVKAATTGSLY